MTAKQAKEETLLVWRYIAENSDKVMEKSDLPEMYKAIIKNYYRMCPLCEYFMEKSRSTGNYFCMECILETCGPKSSYAWWYNAGGSTERQTAAMELVAKVEAWEVGNEQ
jgi:hypothetical protein